MILSTSMTNKRAYISPKSEALPMVCKAQGRISPTRYHSSVVSLLNQQDPMSKPYKGCSAISQKRWSLELCTIGMTAKDCTPILMPTGRVQRSLETANQLLGT